MDNKIQTIADFAVENWRLIRVLQRLLERLPDDIKPRVAAQVRFAESRLQTMSSREHVRLETFEGRAFEANLPVSAVNADEFNGEKDLVIVDTLEPTVLADGQVLQMGKVVLGSGGTHASGY